MLSDYICVYLLHPNQSANLHIYLKFVNISIFIFIVFALISGYVEDLLHLA